MTTQMFDGDDEDQQPKSEPEPEAEPVPEPGPPTRGGSRKKSSPRLIAARQREDLALADRLQGMTLARIAERRGYGSPASAYKAIEAALRRARPAGTQTPEAARELMLARLDAALDGIWPWVRDGSLEHIDRMLKIEARRARLLGLDAPVKIDIAERIRAAAEAEGLDADEVVAEVVKMMGGR